TLQARIALSHVRDACIIGALPGGVNRPRPVPPFRAPPRALYARPLRVETRRPAVLPCRPRGACPSPASHTSPVTVMDRRTFVNRTLAAVAATSLPGALAGAAPAPAAPRPPRAGEPIPVAFVISPGA